MFKFLRKLIPDRHPLRLFYHKIKAVLAAIVYGFPAKNLIVIGVTGTNGKTTTVNLIAKTLQTAGHKVGMTSSINFRIGDEIWANNSKQSTLGPFFMQKMLKRMVKAGCKYAVLEVTSHALDQSRVWGVNFDLALITNMREDHLEYHGSFNNYMQAKGELFRKVSAGKKKFGVPKVMILNSDDEHYGYFNQFVADQKLTYGLKSATVYAENIEKKPTGSHFVLHVPNNAVPIEIKLPGEFNVYNALATAAACMALEIPLDKIKEGLEASQSVRGRYEAIDCGQDFSVIVDYAHTPDALESLFSLYRQLTSGNLFVLTGATGGGRDKRKRPVMGKIADEHADYVILTDDDPYSEDEMGILDQISEGIKRKEGERFWKIPDREEAIRMALGLAGPGDTVVLAGKGAEEIMMVRGKKVEWNDRKVVERILRRDVEVEIGEDEWVKVPKVS